MAVEVRGDNSLQWKASIDLSEIEKQVKNLNRELASIGKGRNMKPDDVAAFYEKQVKEVEKAQERMTKIVKEETQERIDFSRKEMEELFKSGLPTQTTGTKAKQRYEFGVPVKGPEGISDDLKKTLSEVVKETRDLDAATADYIQELVQLQMQQAKLKSVQKELNELYKDGKVDQGEYTKATEQIAGAQKSLADDIKLIGDRQKEYDALKLSEINSTKAQVIQVEKLKQEYLSLSDAQKESAFGQNLKAEIASLNTSIKQTQVELNKTNEVAQKAGNGVTNFFSGAWSYLRRIAYILPGFGVAGIISAITAALGKLIFGSGGFERAFEKLKNSLSGLSEEQIKARKVIDQAASSYTKAVTNVEELRLNIELAKRGYLDKDKVLNQYNETLGKSIGHTNNFEKAEQNLIEKGQAYIDMTLKKSVALLALEEAAKKAFEIEKMRAKEQEEFLTTGDKFIANAARNAYSMGGAQLQDQANKTADQLRKDRAKKRKEDAIKEAEEEQDVYKQISKKSQEQAAELAKAFKINFYDEKQIKESNKAQSDLNTLLDKRKSFLEKIVSLERDAKQSGLIQKEKEIDKINEKYDQQIQSVKNLNAEIEKYNKKYPKKEVPLLGDTETARIEAARQTEIANQAYREDAKNYIDMLDEKRLAFEALEEVEKEGSEQKVQFVRRQYKNQIGEAKSYLDALRTQLASLSLETTVRAPSLKDQIIAGDLRSKIREEEKRISEKQKQDSIQLYTELISLTQKYADKRLAIEKKYSDLLAMLNRDKVNMSVKDYNAALKKLSDLRKQEQQDLSDEFLKNSNAFKEFEKGFSEKTPKDLQKLIDKLKSLREEMKGFGLNLKDVDLAIDATIQEKFASVFGYLSNAMGSLGAEINYQITDTLKITGQQITQIFNNLYTLLSSTSSDSAKSNSLIGLIYTFVNSISSIVTTALQNKKDLESGLEPSAEAANAITLAIQAQNTELERQEKILDGMYGEDKINGLLDLQDQLQKKQKETFEALKKLSIDAIVSQGEYYVDSLFHGRGEALRSDTTAGRIFGILNDPLGFIPKTVRIKLETVDTSSMDTIEDYVALLDEIKANGGKLNGRTIVEDDVKSLEELISNYDDLIQKQKDLKTQLQQIFTATTAGSIADSIIAGFKAGKRTIEDFADDFEDLMRNAVLNSLKYRFLETPLQNFYEEFAKKSASDNILTGQEISELQATYKDILASALQQYQNLSNITGLDMSGLNAESSLTGAIKGMSEQQADLLAGQFGGLRMTAIEQLRVATAGLEVLQRIETNTYVINEVAAHTSAVKDTLRRFELNGLKVV